MRRQTGRHASPTPTDKSQHPCADGKYINVAAQIVNRLTSERLQILGDWMTEQGLAGDILEEKYRNPDSITDNELFLYFIANMDRDDVYHGGQKRGFNMGAVWSPEEVLADPHLQDRGFWAEVDYPEVGAKLRHPGPAGIFNGSPWRISRRAPLGWGAQRRGAVRRAWPDQGGVGGSCGRRRGLAVVKAPVQVPEELVDLGR